jgi:hypothetical protein
VKQLVLAVVVITPGNYVAAAEIGNAPLQLTQTIPLPGVEGRIDHLDFDPTG